MREQFIEIFLFQFSDGSQTAKFSQTFVVYVYKVYDSIQIDFAVIIGIPRREEVNHAETKFKKTNVHFCPVKVINTSYITVAVNFTLPGWKSHCRGQTGICFKSSSGIYAFYTSLRYNPIWKRKLRIAVIITVICVSFAVTSENIGGILFIRPSQRIRLFS